MTSFLSQLKQRRVYRVAIGYAIVAWLMVQIAAPVAACWAAAVAVSDPLSAAQICHDAASGAAGQQDDQSADRRAHDGACAICCAAQARASLDTPQLVGVVSPYRGAAPVVWRDQTSELTRPAVGSNSRARAPPLSM